MQNKIIGKFKKLKPVHWLIIFLGIVLYFGAVLGIIQYQRNQNEQPLMLEIYTPKEGDIYTASDVLIQGKSNKDAIISVGGLSTVADNQGGYSFTVPLAEGENTLKVTADLSDERVEKIVKVARVTPAPTGGTIQKKTPKRSVSKSNISESKLNNTGPESLWLFEAGALSAAGAAWQVSRQRFAKARKA